jgi:hypothetical protein
MAWQLKILAKYLTYITGMLFIYEYMANWENHKRI